MNHPLIEACVDSHASCMAAARGGADRLELCANLAIGGTTPSPSLFCQVRRDFPIPVNVLIRPRFGDFLYSREELEEMAEEIRRFRELGANGVVIGALTPEGELDRSAMARLMEQAGGMEVTLHRAFDMIRDPLEALEEYPRHPSEDRHPGLSHHRPAGPGGQRDALPQGGGVHGTALPVGV